MRYLSAPTARRATASNPQIPGLIVTRPRAWATLRHGQARQRRKELLQGSNSQHTRHLHSVKPAGLHRHEANTTSQDDGVYLNSPACRTQYSCAGICLSRKQHWGAQHLCHGQLRRFAGQRAPVQLLSSAPLPSDCRNIFHCCVAELASGA